jgi:hypothetical protein
MLVLHQSAARPYPGLEDNSFIQALRYMGPGLSRTLQNSLGGYRYILMVVDKFTKWIEV